jgi:hypothetical protein
MTAASSTSFMTSLLRNQQVAMAHPTNHVALHAPEHTRIYLATKLDSANAWRNSLEAKVARLEEQLQLAKATEASLLEHKKSQTASSTALVKKLVAGRFTHRQ